MRKLFVSLFLGIAFLFQWSAQGMEKPFYEKARPERKIQIGTQKYLQLSREKNNLEIVVDVPELKIHGKTGCNIFNGDIGLDRNKDWFIQFQNIIVSRMKCEDSKMAVERDFMVALEETEIIKRENGGKTIRLKDKKKKEVLLLKRIQQ